MLSRHLYPHVTLITLTKITQECTLLIDLVTETLTHLHNVYFVEESCSSLLSHSLLWGGMWQLCVSVAAHRALG